MSLYSDDRRKRKWDTQDSSPSKSRPSREDGDRGSSGRDRSDRYESSRHDERSSSYRDRGDRGERSERRSASPPRGPRDSSKKSGRSGAPTDAAAAAAAAAARIAASLNNRNIIPPTIPQNYGSQPVPLTTASSLPLAITAGPSAHGPPAPPPPSSNPSAQPAPPPPPNIGVVVKKDERGPLGDVYQQDGDWMKDIEINNLRNRYLLTKGATQQQIKQASGADVTTRGKYYPDTALATEREPPLYLHITATTYPALEKASRMVQELIDRDMGSLVDERRFRRTDERDEFGRRKWPEEKIPIGMESVRGFNVRAQIVGPSGSYVKHISTETRTRVQIKGQNSGFLEPSTGRESDEPTFLHITGPDEVEVQRARAMAVDLIDTVRQQYEAHRSGVPPPSAMHYQPQQQPVQGQLAITAPPGVAPPPSSMGGFTYGAPGAGGPPGVPGVSGYSAPGAALGADPYAQYGGHQAYQQYYSNQYSQQRSPPPPPPPPGPPGASTSHPPPPPPPGPPGMNGGYAPANVVSPPPPPGVGGSYASYNAMPPPPGQ